MNTTGAATHSSGLADTTYREEAIPFVIYNTEHRSKYLLDTFIERR
jgi:hypothetical protein